jgi:hypothetical protein
MKMKTYSLIALCASLTIASCSKDGADGKTVLTRTTKEAAGANCTYGGTKFETGVDVNNNGILDDNEVTTTQTNYVCNGAGAIYSGWIDVNVTANSSPFVGEGSFDYKQVLPATAITADVVNKGTILMYYKNAAGYVVPVDVDDVFGIRDTDGAGYYFNFSAGFIFKANYLSFLVDVDYTSDMTAMNANGSAIRYVIIPGNAGGRSVTDLKKLPYSDVAKLYNIED